MSKYNPNQRARDLKKANGELRQTNAFLVSVLDTMEEESYKAGYSHGERASKASAAARFQEVEQKYYHHMRLAALGGSALLVLAVAGWLV
jgi:hypothetical protein